MNLVLTPDNPCPPGANVSTIRAADGMKLRVARWHPAGESRGTVVVAQGRSEYVEKYFETIGELLARGLTVVAFDWRGQGMSDRELDNSRKGHIDDFSLYDRDLDAVVDQVLVPFCPEPWFALAHSMGAAILIRQARAGRSPFERIVAIAPMLALHGLAFEGVLRLTAKILDLSGFGSAFIPRGGETAVQSRPFRDNKLTSDESRYRRNNNIIAAAPHLAIGDPTIGWVDAAFAIFDEFADPEYPRRTLTPILIVAAPGERVVDLRAMERFASRLKAGRMIMLSRGRHEILMERDDIRGQFWAAFDAFVPGAREEFDALVEAQSAIEAARER